MFIVGILFVYTPINAPLKKLTDAEETLVAKYPLKVILHQAICKTDPQTSVQ
jgi:hypothetical protein